MSGKKYNFYGAENTECRAVNSEYPGILTPEDLYDRLYKIWAADTCAPRMRDSWTEENRTLGQCSITAFLAQDIFGGEVRGLLRKGGNYHCFNAVGENVFDLTSEQFGDEVLAFGGYKIQSRESHFQKKEKYERYMKLKERLQRECLENIRKGEE